ncbi:MAG TPA: aminotransferase class V-fold PLP-dependent enzyme, partial [Burkholderiaceae bacterium]|nr:aminotransferase class V-fold PLP-dependent enzyme [Burkholderiaceae bacterium]
RFLHSPGPSHVPPEVIHAMGRQPVDMADPRLDQVIALCEDGLRRLVQTDAGEVFIYATNGHGAWEAVIANLLSPGQRVLVPGTGHFSDSWALQCTAMGIEALRTPWIEGLPIDPAAIEQVLREDTAHDIVAVFAVHTDTASGVSSDMAALRRAIDNAAHPALLVIDVVASLGAAPFAMDALGANVVLGASQKGLMCPPGLGFAIADARALAVSETVTTHRYYWDWRERKSPLAYRKFCGTPPQTLLFGLQAALQLIFDEGVDQVMARHRLLAAAVHAAIERWSVGGDIGFFATDAAARSTSVTAVRVAAGTDVEALRTVARERFQVSIAGGLGPLQGRVFRIGHLGDLNAAMVLGCLGAVQAAMRVQGIALGAGALDAAAECLARG